MNIRSGGLLVACAAFLFASSPVVVQAQPVGDKKKALELYDKAKIQYDLGHWDQAITLWVQAYETYNAPEFLYNIAQAYRQDGDCERSLFFYRRYLATKPNAKNRSEVEGFMKELEASCGKNATPTPGSGAAGGAGKSPGPADGPSMQSGSEPKAGTDPETDADPSSGGPTVADTGADVSDEQDGEGEAGEYEGSLTAPVPHLFAVRAAAGMTFTSFGDKLSVEGKALLALSIGGGYPIHVGKFVLEPGALVTYTRVPWGEDEMPPSGTAGLTSVLANLGVSYEFIPKLSGRAEVGAGVLLFSGLGAEDNPFLEEGEHVEGGKAVLFLAARVALGAEYAVTPNFVIHAQPAILSWSPTRKLDDEINNLVRFEMLFGAGYRM